MNHSYKKVLCILLCAGVFLCLFLAFFYVFKQDASDLRPSPAPDTASPQFSLPKHTLSEVHGFGEYSHLTVLPSQYTQKNEFIHQNTYEPLIALLEAAKKDGVSLKVISAYRSYHHQKQIWEDKWGSSDEADLKKAAEILRWSSYPGTSRHHWGTDVDLNSVSFSYWNSRQGKRTHAWLTANAPHFGFCQTYAQGRTGGYQDEPWHWSHLPTANHYQEKISTADALDVILAQTVKGAAAVRTMKDTLSNHIQSISPCSPTPQAPSTNPITPSLSQKFT
ncbi:MAG: M15 family metallopeptidase [Moraxella sp.]|nr:M15 family metallopeptidase [Moraxella sp.]